MDQLISGWSGQVSAIRAEYDAADDTGHHLPAREQLFACLGIPDTHGSVFTAGHERPRVRAKVYASHGARVAVKREQRLAGSRIPDADRLIFARGSQVGAVRTIGHAADLSLVPAQRV